MTRFRDGWCVQGIMGPREGWSVLEDIWASLDVSWNELVGKERQMVGADGGQLESEVTG